MRYAGRYKYIVAVALLSVLSLKTAAQSTQKSFSYKESEFTVEKSYTTEEGMPANGVNSILQSSDGYIWAATYNGLVRFDGHTIKVYDRSNVPGLESNRFLEVVEDKQGRIWAGLEYNSLLRIDGDSVKAMKIDETETNFNNHLSQICFTEDGKVWVGTNQGLFQYVDGAFSSVGNLPKENVQQVIQHGDTFYVLFHNGLYSLTEDGTVINQLLQVDEEGVISSPDFRITDIAQPGFSLTAMKVKNDTIRILSEGGLFEINTQNPSYKVLITNQELRQELLYGFKTNAGTTLIYGTNGLQRVAGLESGNVEITRYADYHARDVLLDSEGSVWMATTSFGLKQFVSTPVNQGDQYNRLDGIPITAILKGSDDALYIGTNCDGLYAFDNGAVNNFGTDDGIINTCIWSLYEQKDGTLWAGTWGRGVFFRSPGSQRFQAFQPAALQGIQVFLSIYEDSRGHIYFGTYQDGLFVRNDKGITSVKDTDARPLPAIRMLMEDDEEVVWAATDRGVGYVKGSTFVVPEELRSLSTQNIRTIDEDKDGRYWFGSYGGGLFVYEKGNDPRQITQEDGLYDNTISQFQLDESGNVWLAGNLGVFYIEKAILESFLNNEAESLRVKKLGVKEGLPIRETAGGFMPSSYLDGDVLYIPTVQGLAEIHTDKLTLNRSIPQVQIQEVLVDEKVLTNEHQLEKISYQNQRITFRYTALSFNNPDNIEYKYQLVGQDEKWQSTGDTEAIYTSIAPGSYTFRVIASNNDGFWNESGAEISFVIPPPFWKRGWFYLLLFLAVNGCFAGILHYRTRSLQRREKKLSKRVKEQTATIRTEKELVEEAYSELEKSKKLIEKSKVTIEEQAKLLKKQDEIKSQFFANVSHGLRTPLTLIKGITAQIQKGTYGELEPKIYQELNTLKESANRLQAQVDYLLELSNIEIGEVQLKKKMYDFGAQAALIIGMLQNWANQNEIRFEFEEPERLLKVNADSEKMEKIILFLFSKAISYTAKGGWIKLKVDELEAERRVCLEISCSAEEFTSEDRKWIFDRYHYQSKTAEILVYAGYPLVKEWVELHGGKLAVNDSDSTLNMLIYLPLVPDSADAVDEPSEVVLHSDFKSEDWDESQTENQKKPKPDPAKKTILLVEDTPSVRMLISEVLRDTYNVVTAENGAEGLKRMSKDIDVVLSDVMMPVMDGYELCRKLKENPETAGKPVILLTARAGEESHLDGLRSGADAYITKPFKESVLKETIRNLIDNRSILLEKFRQQESSHHNSLLKEGEDSLLIKLDKLIDEHMENSDLTIEELAEKLHLSQRQLQRKIKDETGLTPKKYLRKRRLKAAKFLIENDYGNISEIAFSVGFNTLPLFSSYFKEEFGVLPSKIKTGN